MIVAIIIPILSLILGNIYNGTAISVAACAIEIVFVFILYAELKKMKAN